jgi:hypothetical protein
VISARDLRARVFLFLKPCCRYAAAAEDGLRVTFFDPTPNVITLNLLLRFRLTIASGRIESK